jgi:hypothetical protein
MHRFLVFRCPATGMKVQATFAAKDEAEDRSETYETVSCPACAGVHFINLKTGRIQASRSDAL